MKEEKAALRRRYKALRNGLNTGDREAWSLQICHRLEALSKERHLRRIGVFWPYGSEVDLRPLVRSRPDWVFVFPRIASTDPPRLVWGPEPLEPGLFGLQEPVNAQHLLPPVQLLLVPGLAFDPEGYRLGYGGGYYDALLARLEGGILTVAVGFEAQVTDPLPRSPQDMPVQGLVTETGLRWFGG
jgi:5-formyltetrahydrofolate cyclo-ligase